MAESVFRADLFKGKSAVVTGGGSGINLGIALKLAAFGAKLTLIGRSAERLAGAEEKVKAAGGAVVTASADVRDPAALGLAFEKSVAAHGPIDILVCGAAGNFPAPAVGISPNGFKAVVDIDLLGTFNACRLAFEHLRTPGACIVNISAPQAVLPTALQAHVCAAKAGVEMLTRTLALEWGGAGVRVNGISPGPVDETEGMKRLAPTEEARRRVIENVPLGRFAHVNDIADATVFLCSDAARYVTGAVLACDGGQSLMGSGMMSKALGF